MHLLVSGGTGFIGTRLALMASKRGHRVRVLALASTPAARDSKAELEAAGIEVMIGRVTDAARCREAVQGIDAVIHLAAAQHEMNVPDSHYEEVNIDGTILLLDAAIAAGVKRFVHASTIGIWGEKEGRFDETCPPSPDNIYGRTKFIGEQVLAARMDEIELVCVRVPETYGPGDPRLLKLFRMAARGRVVMIGKGRNLHHPIYVDDLADAFLLMLDHPAAVGECFVLSGPEPISSRQMIETIASTLGRPGIRISLPIWPLLVLAWLCEATLRPLGLQPPLHRRRLGFFTKNQTIDSSKARRLLGFTGRTGFAEGVRQSAAWYMANNLIDPSLEPVSSNT